MFKTFFNWLKSLFSSKKIESKEASIEVPSTCDVKVKDIQEIVYSNHKMKRILSASDKSLSQLSPEAQERIRSTYVERNARDNNDGFFESAVIAGMTDNVLVGGLIGGSIAGAVIGSALFGNDDAEDSYQPESTSRYVDDSWSQSSDSYSSSDSSSSSDSYSSSDSSSSSSD